MGGFGEEFKYHFGGSGIGSPIANGGLGVRKISTFNQDLLGKMALVLWVGRHIYGDG